MKRGAIYARVSDPSDLRVASIESQIEAVKAKLVGYKIDQFVERHTAAKLWERVELNKLRERIRSGYYQKVGVYCIDRLSRDGAHLAILFEEAERYNCELFSATEVIENTPEGKLMLAVRGFVAEVERLKIRERTQRGTQRLFDENKIICSGWARFGYKYNKATRTREIEPTAAAIVRRMFDLAASGKSIRSITTIFNNEHVPTSYELLGMGRRSRGWVMATVREMLIDPSYYGQPIQWKGQGPGWAYSAYS